MNGGKNMYNENIKSDAEWYCRKDENSELYYSIFFTFCKKYNVSWQTASEKEKAFIEEIVRVTYEKKIAKQKGLPESSVRPAFVA